MGGQTGGLRRWAFGEAGQIAAVEAAVVKASESLKAGRRPRQDGRGGSRADGGNAQASRRK